MVAGKGRGSGITRLGLHPTTALPARIALDLDEIVRAKVSIRMA